MSHDGDETRVEGSWPYELPDPVHDWVYYVFGSLAEHGRLTYEPDPAETARRLAQPWRWRQQRLFGSEEAAPAL